MSTRYSAARTTTVVVRGTNVVRRGLDLQGTKWIIGVAMSATLAAFVLAAGVAGAQEESAQLQLTPSRDSEVSGTATLTGVEGGVEVDLEMVGLPEEGIEHINHFHEGGTCARDRAGTTAPATIPLETVVAAPDGTGSSSTLLEDVTLEQLFDESKDRYLALHSRTEEGQGVPPVISCADVVRTAADTMSGDLPPSGGVIRPITLLYLAASVAICGVVVGLPALRRRGARLAARITR